VTVNKLFKARSVNAMMIPMNIRPDDVTFTVSQMRNSKLNGAIIGTEYQEETYSLADEISDEAEKGGYCDLIMIENGRLIGDLIAHRALDRYAEHPDLTENVAMMATCYYFFELVTGERL
jgi:shikimate 5-dehydrogenase